MLSTTLGLVLGLGNFWQNEEKEIDGITNTDTDSYVKVDEIYKTGEGFDKDNLSKLYQYITGNASADLSTIQSISSTNRDAAYFRNQAVGDKASGKDIVVRFGGLDWQVVYLSTDTDGNPILTLWLSNSTQEAFAGRSATEGENYGFLNGGLYSTWTNNLACDYSSINHPSNMYSTSYISVVTLNNGGQYLSSINGNSETSTTTLTTMLQSNTNVFSSFTMGELTDYIVTPANTPYQHNQSVTTQFGTEYDYTNDSPTPLKNPNYFSGYNVGNDLTSQKLEYYNWKNDKLWLPSIVEVGRTAKQGLWNTSITQRQFHDGSNGLSKIGEAGKNTIGAYPEGWLRTGAYNNPGEAACLEPAGDYYFAWAFACYAVRPALHLNMAKAVPPPPTNWIGIPDTSWEVEGAGDSEENPYIIDTPEKLAGIAEKVNSGTTYSGKYFKQTCNINLGGYDWTPIGNESNVFAGSFDGGEFCISNMIINSSQIGSGLFGVVANAKIHKVKIKRSILNSSMAQSGGLIGQASQSTIQDVMVDCMVTYTGPQGKYIRSGGVIGFANTCSFKNLEFYGNVLCLNSGQEVGGIVGSADNNSIIQKCYNYGKVENYLNGTGVNTGGIVGYVNKVDIEDCHNYGSLFGGQTTGGIVGYLTDASVRRCINDATLRSNKWNLGGIAGAAHNYVGNLTASIQDCAVYGYLDISLTDSSESVGSILGRQTLENSMIEIENCNSIAGCSVSVINIVGVVLNSNLSISSSYQVVNKNKVYTDGNFDGFSLVDGMNSGYPIQKALFWQAEFGEDVTAAWFESNGWTKVA